MVLCSIMSVVSFLARPRKGMTDEEVLIEFLGTFEAHH